MVRAKIIEIEVFFMFSIIHSFILQQNEINEYHVHHIYFQFYPNFPSYTSILIRHLDDYVMLMQQNQLNDLVFELHSKTDFYLSKHLKNLFYFVPKKF